MPRLLNLLFPAVLALISVGCAQQRTIPDASVPVTFTIPASCSRPVSVHLHITGTLLGTAELELLISPSAGVPIRTIPLAGKVDLNLTEDWYSNPLILKYHPITPTKGALSLDIDFGCLP